MADQLEQGLKPARASDLTPEQYEPAGEIENCGKAMPPNVGLLPDGAVKTVMDMDYDELMDGTIHVIDKAAIGNVLKVSVVCTKRATLINTGRRAVNDHLNSSPTHSSWAGQGISASTSLVAFDPKRPWADPYVVTREPGGKDINWAYMQVFDVTRGI